MTHFNTPFALELLLKVVSWTNVYINSRGWSLTLTLVEGISAWFTRILKTFGVGMGDKLEELSWGDDSQLYNAAMFNVSEQFNHAFLPAIFLVQRSPYAIFAGFVLVPG